MKRIAFGNPWEEDFSVRDLRFYEQSYFSNGSKVNFLSKPRMHHGILYVKSCTITMTFLDGSKMRAERGDIIYLPRGCHYKTVFSDVTDKVATLLFNFNLEHRGESFYLSDSIEKIRLEKADEQRRLIELATRAKWSPLALKSALYGILELWREQEQPKHFARGEALGVIAPAIAFIRRHEDNSISVAELADMCHMSQSFFRKRFSELMGMPPKEYCLKLRLERARILLESGDFTVSEVSGLLGFSSPSYFSRIFKQKTGFSPVDFIKSKG